MVLQPCEVSGNQMSQDVCEMRTGRWTYAAQVSASAVLISGGESPKVLALSYSRAGFASPEEPAVKGEEGSTNGWHTCHVNLSHL